MNRTNFCCTCTPQWKTQHQPVQLQNQHGLEILAVLLRIEQ